MNPKVYKYFGLVLIILSLISVGQLLFSAVMGFVSSITEGLEPFMIEALLTLLGLAILTFVLGFFPGKYYYKFGKNKKIDDPLIKTSLILLSLSILFVILSIAVMFLSVVIDFSNPLGGFTSTTLFTTIISSLIYIVGIIFLIIHIKKQKKKNNNKSLKKKS